MDNASGRGHHALRPWSSSPHAGDPEMDNASFRPWSSCTQGAMDRPEAPVLGQINFILQALVHVHPRRHGKACGVCAAPEQSHFQDGQCPFQAVAIMHQRRP